MKKKLIGHKTKYVSAPSLDQTLRQCIQNHPEKEIEIKRYFADCEADQEWGGIATQEIQIALLSTFPRLKPWLT